MQTPLALFSRRAAMLPQRSRSSLPECWSSQMRLAQAPDPPPT
jgi:hypothetical protein